MNSAALSALLVLFVIEDVMSAEDANYDAVQSYAEMIGLFCELQDKQKDSLLSCVFKNPQAMEALKKQKKNINNLKSDMCGEKDIPEYVVELLTTYAEVLASCAEK
uniref:Putative secreted protein n=1 Tax=Amblyomma parvum TaxID=251391 RepID=A0A023G2K4_AMBPA